MKKIPCLFARDFTDKRRPVLLRDVSPGCGVGHRRRGGSNAQARRDRVCSHRWEFKRYDVKKGKSVPQGAIPCDEPDPITGHWPHWIEVGSEPDSRYHVEAFTGLRSSDGSRFRPREPIADGTYELVGPKVQGNPEGFAEHTLVRHGTEAVDPPRTWDGLRDFLASYDGEGIVFHHPDGRMCKIRRDDFGFDWPPKASTSAS